MNKRGKICWVCWEAVRQCRRKGKCQTWETCRGIVTCTGVQGRLEWRTPGFAKTAFVWVSADTERMQKNGCRFLKQQKYHCTWRLSSLKMLELNISVFCNSRTVFHRRRFWKDCVHSLSCDVSASLSPGYHLLIRSQWNSQMDNSRLPVQDLWQAYLWRPGFPKFVEHRSAAEQKYFQVQDIEYLVALQFSSRGGCPSDWN